LGHLWTGDPPCGRAREGARDGGQADAAAAAGAPLLADDVGFEAAEPEEESEVEDGSADFDLPLPDFFAATRLSVR
jgi:hypothetical protein